jgi:hypothetical protein
MSEPSFDFFEDIFNKKSEPDQSEAVVVFPEPPEAHPAPVVGPQRTVETVPVYKGSVDVTLPSLKTQNTICSVARFLYLKTGEIDATAIYENWPTTENLDPTNLIDSFALIKAVTRPSAIKIAEYITTEAFTLKMASIGVHLSGGLTSRQIALLDSLSDISDKMSLSTRLRKLGISVVEFKGWLKHDAFLKAYNQFGEGAMRNAIPLAKVQLAKKMEQGDLGAIKFGFEVTGEYNPNDRKQVDAQRLVQVIFDVIEEEIKDPELIRRIGSKITLRGNMGRAELTD